MLVNPSRFGATGGGPATSRYWRINVTANNGDTYTSIQEIELRGTVGGSDLTTSSTPTNQSDYYAPNSNDASKTVDGDVSDVNFGCWVSDGSALPHWLTYDLGTSQTVAELAMLNQIGFEARAPKDFTLQTASSLAGPWTSVLTKTGVTTWDDTMMAFSL